MPISLLLLLLLPGCGPGVDPCADDLAGLGRFALASPSDGVAVRAPWIPIMGPVARADEGAAILMCLDGARYEDPYALVRRRAGGTGGGHDLLAGLDLVDLEPGPHVLRVVLTRPGGRRTYAESHFTWDRPRHRVRVHVVDDAGRPTSARVVVTDERGLVDLGTVDDVDADPSRRDVRLHSIFAVGGEGTVWLDPGWYRLLAVRGVREELGVASFFLVADREQRLVVSTAVDAPEYVSADLHVHTGASYDSFIPDVVRFRSLEASGLDVAVLTDHNLVASVPPALDAHGRLRVVPGIEADIRDQGPSEGPDWDLGHINAFPVRGADAAPIPDKKPSSVGAYIDTWRARQRRAPFPGLGGDLVLQLNHPRGIHFWPDRAPQRAAWPLFRMLDFDPEVPVGTGTNAWMTAPEPGTGTTALDFDAVEVMNRFSLPLYREVRRDWFALLNHGHLVTGTGNSDSHALQVEVAGFPANLVRAPRPAPGADLDLPAFVAALRAGEVIVTTGPVVELAVEGPGGVAGPGGLVSGGPVVARVRVRAPSWVPVPELRLVVDGEVVQTVPLDSEGPLDASFSFALALSADAWIVAEAGWRLEGDADTQPEVGGDYGRVVPGYVPLAFTNPVRVDLDADGVWTAPGLREP